MLRRKVPEVKLLVDNKSAVVLSKNPVTMGKAKSEHTGSEQFPSENAATKTFFTRMQPVRHLDIRFKLDSKQMQSGRKFREKTN